VGCTKSLRAMSKEILSVPTCSGNGLSPDLPANSRRGRLSTKVPPFFSRPDVGALGAIPPSRLPLADWLTSISATGVKMERR